MKKILLYSLIIMLIAAAWIGGCSRGGYRQGLKDGAKIERLKKAAFWDSINLDKSKQIISCYEKTNNALKCEISTLEQRLYFMNVMYQNKAKTVQSYSKQQIDSIYLVYAKDSIEAVQNFIELEKCAEESVLLRQKINLMESISTNNQKIITELKEFIENEQNSRIELREQNEMLTGDLAITQNKLKKRTAQRNLTWAGLIVLGVGFIILN